MKRKSVLKRLVSSVIIMVMMLTILPNAMPMKASAAASSKKLGSTYFNATTKYLYLGDEGADSFNFNIKKDAKKAGVSYSWYVKADKGNPDAVTINKKNGVVTAKQAGTAYIRCKITFADNTYVSPEAKVTIRNNITDVKIKSLPDDMTISAGRMTDFNRTILNTEGGKGKKTEGITRWEIKDDTAGVVSANDKGIVYPIQKGEFKIRAVSFQSNAKYNLWLDDKEIKEKYITASSDWHTIMVKSSEGQAIANTQVQLNKALQSDEVNDITLSSINAETFIIEEGDYTTKSLTVDAPKADVENHGIFKEITIKAIKDTTWIEHADGNIVYLLDNNLSLVIDKNAKVKKLVIDTPNSIMNLVIHGMVDMIIVLQPSRMNLSGDSKNVPISIEENAEGSKIASSVSMNLTLNANTEIVLDQGAEETKIDKSASSVEVQIDNKSVRAIVITTNNSNAETIKSGEKRISNETTIPSPAPSPGGGPSYIPPTPPTPPISVTGVTLSSTTMTLMVGGENGVIAAYVIPSDASNKKVTWTSDKENVATVQDGVVTPVAAGTALITVTTEDGNKTANCVVTVNEAPLVNVPVESVNITGAETVEVGKTIQLSAQVLPLNALNRTVTWSVIYRTGKATIDENGLLTAVADGTVTVRATAKDGSVVYGQKDITISGQVEPQPGGGETWIKTFNPGLSEGYGFNYDAKMDVKVTSDGGYIVVGNVKSNGGDAYLLKVNSDGTKEWEKTLSFEEGLTSDSAYSVHQVSDGGYLVAGNTIIKKLGSDINYLLVIKTNNMGDKVWEKTYEEDGAGAYAIQPTNDGGYIIAGEANFGNLEPDFNVYLIKIDAEGNQTWAKNYDEASADPSRPNWETGFAIKQTSDGGYIVAGKTCPYQSSDRGDIYVIKTDSKGEKQWDYSYGNSDGNVAFAVEETTEGYAIAGYSKTTQHTADFSLINLNKTGEEINIFTFGYNNINYGRGMIKTSDEGYILTGTTKIDTVLDNQVYLVKVNKDGVKEWERTFGGRLEQGSYAVQQSSDGGYIIAGYTVINGTKEIYLLKTDSQGKVVGVLDTHAIDNAIRAANDAKEGVVISFFNGTDVEPANEWVTYAVNEQVDNAMLQANYVKDSVKNEQEVADVVAALNEAVATYNVAKKLGTKVISADITRELPGLAYDPVKDMYLMVYKRGDTWHTLDETGIYGRFVLPGGDFSGEEFVIASSETIGFFSPTVVSYDTKKNRFLVVWDDARDNTTGGQWNIYGQFVSPEGVPSGVTFPISNITDGRQQTNPGIAFDSLNGNFLIIYNWGEQQGDLHCRLLKADDTLGEDALIAGGLWNQSGTSVEFNGTSFLVAYNDQADENNVVNKVKLINSSGIPSVDGILFTSQGDGLGIPELAYNAQKEKFLAVWSTGYVGMSSLWDDICGSIVEKEGSSANRFIIADNTKDKQFFPDVATVGDKFAVVWMDAVSESIFKLRASIVSTDKTVSEPIVIDTNVVGVDPSLTVCGGKDGALAAYEVQIGDDSNMKDIQVKKIDLDLSTDIPEETDAGYFTFDRNTGTITGYNKEGGLDVVIPSTIDEVTVISLGVSAFSSKDLTSVSIPNSVTCIGDYAFHNNPLTSVTIPNSVTSIGEFAFRGNKLTSVSIPNSVISIGKRAFDANKLVDVSISNGVISIGDHAFADNFIADVIIPNSVSEIGEFAFSANKLTDVIIPNSVTSIGAFAFSYNLLTDVTISNNLEIIEKGTFEGNQLTSVTIPDSVITICDNAFVINQLTDLLIGNKVTTIGGYAFSENQLSNVTIPDSVKGIGQSAFYGNILTSITLGSDVEFDLILIDSGTNMNNFREAYVIGGAGSYIGTQTGTWEKEK